VVIDLREKAERKEKKGAGEKAEVTQQIKNVVEKINAGK